MRQALAGMLWSKQFYHYDVDKWLEERGSDPFKPTRKAAPRNDHWHHMYNGDVISMPDKWEYPWYAAWDLAFHVLALTLVDPDFGKQQLKLMLRERYMHPNGQIPAYEWNFGDVNPPVHAWSTIFTYRLEKAQQGEGDKEWLKSCFQKLLLNFTWWVNRKDRSGRNVFEGGFLGLDNIGVFDRSAPLPTGGYLEQADGTAWMALFCQNMLEIAAELAMTDPDYADMALKFVEHFLWIASAMAHLGGDTGMWDEEDGFFYDVLRLARRPGPAAQGSVHGRAACRCVRPRSSTGRCWRSTRNSPSGSSGSSTARPELLAAIHDPQQARRRGPPPGFDPGRNQAPPRAGEDARRERVPQPVTASARCRATTPTIPTSSTPAARNTVSPICRPSPTPACSAATRTGAGPIWMPVNALIIRALLQYYAYYGDEFTVECPTGSGRQMNLYQVAEEIARRLANIFLKDKDGRRPVYGGTQKFQDDPHWRDCLLFYEYFHGDNGAGLGAAIRPAGRGSSPGSCTCSRP